MFSNLLPYVTAQRRAIVPNPPYSRRASLPAHPFPTTLSASTCKNGAYVEPDHSHSAPMALM